EGRATEAEEYFRKALPLNEDVARDFPTNPDVQGQLGMTLACLAGLLWSTDRKAEATDLYGLLRELRPDSVEAYNNLAWCLATCPDPDCRDVDKALSMAKKAVEFAPKQWAYLNTLGVAHYRAKNWREAIDALQKSMEQRKGGDPFDWFFLAMT